MAVQNSFKTKEIAFTQTQGSKGILDDFKTSKVVETKELKATTSNITTANVTTLALSGAATTTYDNSSADTAYVPMVLYNTDATPPAANTVPIGTIYIQYTP